MKSNSILKIIANQRRSLEYLRIANLIPNHRYGSPSSRIRIGDRSYPTATANTASSIIAGSGALPRNGPPSPLRRAGAGGTGLRLGGSGTAEPAAIRGLEELDCEIVEADLREDGAADGVDEAAFQSTAIGAAAVVVARGEGVAGGAAETPGAAVVEGGGRGGGVVGGGGSDGSSLGGGFECRGGHRRKGKLKCRILGL